MNPVKHRFFLIFIAISFFYVFYPFHIKTGFISADAVFDANIVKNILSGNGLGWQATLQPPFQAILTTIFYPLFADILSSGVFVSKLMWWLLPVPVYFLAYALFGVRTALISSVLVFFHPHFGSAASIMEPTVTYTTLLMTATCFTWLAISKKNHLFALLSGIFFAFAYLSRSEGFLIIFFIIATLTLMAFFEWKKNFTELPSTVLKSSLISKLLILIIIVATFTVTSLPYLFFLKQTYGKWVLSPKSSYVQIWMKDRIYHDNNLGEQENPDLWGITKGGKLKWQEPKGIADLTNYLLSHPKKSLHVYLTNFKGQLPGYIANSSGQWFYPQVFPWYFTLPAIFWIIFSFLKKKDRHKTLFLLAPFAILFILPIFSHGWWKYLLPYSPFLIILGAASSTLITYNIRLNCLLSLLTAIIVLYSSYVVKANSKFAIEHYNKNPSRKVLLAEEQKNAGEWANINLAPNSNYMLEWSRLPYYLAGKWTARPKASYSQMIRYARNNSVDYIVYQVIYDDLHFRQLKTFKPRELEYAGAYESDKTSYQAVFFKLRK